ncbi:N-acetylneuraminate synthase family protein [Aliarcobacter cryaerophilus]|uniref:N-acetylneuraminate synthase family protein n=1 Tax=Aliarcobacter cryaerophilus TaxID=28198 RepID=UPI0021B55BC4|nr:N-acetylneuraminate synthase family protein [Aliarcobacter cryaerophilus]MCT7493792.1 FAD-dependent oxidoreductase [Aliarcobacter cryaerophilus]
MKKYYILGAGVTGLTLAYELLKKGQDVEIIEKDLQVGGLAKTFTWKGREIDLGPHIYHTPDKDIQEYWEREFEGLFYERDHWSKNLKNGQYFDYPISKEFIESLPNDIKTTIYNELKSCNQSDLINAKNYYEYIKALAGKTLQEMFFIRYPEKLWGIPTTKLDANWAPKRIQIREKATPFYWGQWAAVGNEGSGTIIKSLENKVISLGGKINTNETIYKLHLQKSRISTIETDKRVINIRNFDTVINTTSYTVISKLIGKATNLKYRGIVLVFLELNHTDILPKGIDFIYIDDKEIYFNRVSDQNSFVKNPDLNKTIVCCEIAYSLGDDYDNMNQNLLIENVKQQFVSLGLTKNKNNILDSKVIKLTEVYPMFFVGYQNELALTKATIDSLGNMYTIGSLAEYAYSDLQVLFGKAIDLAEVLTDKTFNINKIDKTIPRLKFKNKVNIVGVDIGENEKTFIIAEIGLNHNGDLNLAKQLIDLAIDNGADAVKLQSYKSKHRIAKEGKTSRYVEKILGTEETDFEMFKKNELTFEQTKELFDYAKGRTIIFSAPFDLESVDELESLGIDCYKIASFDLVNLPLIKKVAATQKPIIISTGMSSLSEVEDALYAVASMGNDNIILLQCTSSYPCPPESMNIKAIDTMRQAFGGLPVGLSDHVIGDTVSLAAVARGANVIEKHFTIDKRMEGPDHILSLTPSELKDMVLRIRLIEEALGDGIKQASPDEMTTIIRFRKTMYSNRDIKQGEKISSEDIIYKGPAYGIYAKYENIVFGQYAVKEIKKDTPITWDLISQKECNE